MASSLVPIEIIPGVEPSVDRTATTTQHYTYTKAIRFVDGFPEKMAGWNCLRFNDSDSSINGKVRSIFSYKLSGYTRYLLGSSSHLYDVFGSVLTNITPVKTSTIAIADSLDTYYGALGSDPFTVLSGFSNIVVTDVAHKFKVGQFVTLSGAATTRGIPNTEINAEHYIRAVTTNTYTITVSTTATSNGPGGGASVVRASGILTVNATAHGLSNGDRVKILAAADTGGILAAEINLEHIVLNVSTNTFDIYTQGTATSAVSGGGGVSTTYQEPIDAGSENTRQGEGYGMGLYGAGLYGITKTSTNSTPARIWSHSRFGDLTLSAHNTQSDIYSWNGLIAAAPVKVANSPLTNYVFVSNEIVVALGYDTGLAAANGNGISWSDQGGLTNWTTGQSGSDTIEGAGIFISHASARGENLLFTENQVYTFRYIGGQFIWQTTLLENGIGLIAQNARVSASGVIYWMANNNFYMWRGGNVEVIPSNSSTGCTALHYVFDDLNFNQKEKVFCWFNEQYREVSWHYPSSQSNEPDRVIRVNIDTFVWTIDEIDRTAAEYPSVLTQTPYMTGTAGQVFVHESGINDDGAGMDWRLTTNFAFAGTDTVEIGAIIPDVDMTKTMAISIRTKDYPLSSTRYNKNYTLSSAISRLPVELNGRYWQFDIFGNSVDQELMFGQWYMELKKGSPK